MHTSFPKTKKGGRNGSSPLRESSLNLPVLPGCKPSL
ncbi:Apolipophorin [Frankliniella fusca]|uniref:Apolipophorin n=1 Tax=Frankliniella fusca TaxID=407009 RepID=A0AAE1LFB9_9NEOP|nr:Apolipophorin [Frankliniella fusca]